MSMSQQHHQLRKDIVDFLVTLSVLRDSSGRASFLEGAGLDAEFSQYIDIKGAPRDFCDHLYGRAVEYGDLQDGRDAVVAILEAAKLYVGVSKKAHLQNLTIQRHQILEKSKNITSSFETDTWFYLLNKHFNLDEIKTLCFNLNKDYESLPGNGKRAKIRELLLHMQHSGQLHDLREKVFIEKPRITWPEIPINHLNLPTENKGSIPEKPSYEEPYLPFANREPEIDRIVTYPDEGSYYLFEGPAGYGKTRLLLEIKKRLSNSERNWLCTYVCLSENSDFKGTIHQLIDSIGLKRKRYNFERPLSIGEDVGKAVSKLRDKHKFQGFCLLLDIDKEPFEYLAPTVKMIADEFIKGVYSGLTYRPSSFFRIKEKRFKFIISGRYLTTYIYPHLSSKELFSVICLKPFNYEVVRQICSTSTFKDKTNLDDFAAHLLFHSGGHPGCMAKILEVLEKRQTENPTEFFSNYWQDMANIAGHQASQVRASITPSLRETFDVISLYPRFDYVILEKLMSMGIVSKEPNEDAYSLAMRLKRSFLIDWADDNRLHLSDSITRHLLTIGLRHNHPGKYPRLCENVYDNCKARMEDQAALPFQWAVETLTAFLQIHTNQIQDPLFRLQLRKEFFDNELLNTLRQLVDDRDKRVEKEPFLRAAEKHPDFRFMSNYYLRESVYDDSPYQQFLKVTTQFFSQ